MQAGDGCGHGIPERVADQLVALLVSDVGVALHRGGMRARGQQPGPGRQHGSPHITQRTHGFAAAVADIGDQLDLTGVQLALDRPRDRTQAFVNGLR
jgi:hypothetical protein